MALKKLLIGIVFIFFFFSNVYSAVQNLDVQTCSTCTVSDINANNTNIGATIGKGVTESTLTWSDPVGLYDDAQITDVKLHLRHGGESGINNNWGLTLQNNAATTTYCTDNSEPHASSDTYAVFDTDTSCTWTIAELTDLRIDYTNNDAAKGQDAYIYYTDIYITYNEVPVWTVNLSANVSSATIGDVIQYSATGTDGDADTYKLIVCSTDAQTSGTCDATQFCASSLTTSGTQVTCDYDTTGQSAGDLVGYGFLCDSNNYCGSSTSDTVTLIPGLGSLTITLNSPTENQSLFQYDTFIMDITVTCSGGNCGNITTYSRYNGSSSTPDTIISNTTGDSPVWTMGGQYQYSPSELNSSNQNWTTTFTLNVTAPKSTSYLVDIYVNSSTYSGITPVNSDDIKFSVYNSCYYRGTGLWNVNLSDNCILNSTIDIGYNTIRAYGSGSLTLSDSANIICREFHFEPTSLDGSNQFIKKPGSVFNVMPTQLKQNLEAYWAMDTDGSINDSTGNGHHGIYDLNSNEFNSSGKIGGAYEFYNNDSQVINFTDWDITSTNPLQLSNFGWIKTSEVTSLILVRNSSNFGWGMYTSGTNLQVQISDTPRNGKTYAMNVPELFDNNWHHIGFVFNNNTLDLYYDGVKNPYNITKSQDDTLTDIIEGNMFPTLAGMYISGNPFGYVNGTLDEIGLWNRALSENEVEELYNLGVGNAYPFD